MDGGRVEAGRNLRISAALSDNSQPVPTEKLNSAPLPPVTLATKGVSVTLPSPTRCPISFPAQSRRSRRGLGVRRGRGARGQGTSGGWGETRAGGIREVGQGWAPGPA